MQSLIDIDPMLLEKKIFSQLHVSPLDKGCDPSFNEFISLSSHEVLWPVWLNIWRRRFLNGLNVLLPLSLSEGNENEDSLLTYVKTHRQTDGRPAHDQKLHLVCA